jgi:hypothetical protein
MDLLTWRLLDLYMSRRLLSVLTADRITSAQNVFRCCLTADRSTTVQNVFRCCSRRKDRFLCRVLAQHLVIKLPESRPLLPM